MIRALFVTIFVFLYIFFVGLPFLIRALIIGNTDALYAVGRWGAKMALRLSGVRLDVRGVENIPQGRAAVYMPNHQSNSDPPAVFTVLPPLLVLAKKEFFGIPVLGRAMRLRGFIPVDRKNRESAIRAVEQAVLSLKAGHSFLAFPEGTRSPDGRLQSFKKGVFIMALEAGAPIVPISVSGSSKIMRKGEWIIRPGVMRIIIHKEVPTQGGSPDERETIMAEVRKAILSGLEPEEWPADSRSGNRGR